jgi:hypothetical protein
MRTAIALFALVGSLLIGWLTLTPSALADTLVSKAPETASAYIIAPADGATVSSPITVKFGLSGMGIAPAGVNKDNTGHHHLLVDLAELPDLSQPLASTEHIKHFGGGQTETTLELSPGEHTLQLLLANYAHVPHEPAVISEPISIMVE